MLFIMYKHFKKSPTITSTFTILQRKSILAQRFSFSIFWTSWFQLYLQLDRILVEEKNYHAINRKDVRKTSTAFRNRPKPDANLQIQRPTKVPIQYGEKLNALLDDLQKMEFWNKLAQTRIKSRIMELILFLMMIIKLIPSNKFMLNSRHLNWDTHHSFLFWPLKLLAAQLARANELYKSFFDIM